MKISNAKLNLLIAWDWLMDYWWVPTLLVLIAVANIVSEIAYAYIGIGMTLIAVVLIIISAIITTYTHYKVKRLNKQKMIEYRRLILKINKERMLRRKMMELQWLSGAPITLHDKDGTIRIIQSGQTDVVVSTMN
jgi:hypothetical protein